MSNADEDAKQLELFILVKSKLLFTPGRKVKMVQVLQQMIWLLKTQVKYTRTHMIQ